MAKHTGPRQRLGTGWNNMFPIVFSFSPSGPSSSFCPLPFFFPLLTLPTFCASVNYWLPKLKSLTCWNYFCLVESRLWVPFSFSLLCQQEGWAQISPQQSTGSTSSDACWAVHCSRYKQRGGSLILPARSLCSSRGKHAWQQPNLRQGRITEGQVIKFQWVCQSPPGDYTVENFFSTNTSINKSTK